MGDSEWLITGLIIGVLVGIPLGWILSQALKPTSSSVIFDRDEKSNITAIHYTRGR